MSLLETPSAAELAAALADLEAVRRRVLNVVGHELRTPTSTIRGLAEELAATDDHDTRAELADALLRSARRLEHLLDDLLVAAGISTALPTGLAELVDLASLAREVWDEVGQGVADVTGDAPPAIVERAAAGRIVGAVLDNAFRYGDAPPSVTVGVSGDAVCLEVTSPGAPPTPRRFGWPWSPSTAGSRP